MLNYLVFYYSIKKTHYIVCCNSYFDKKKLYLPNLAQSGVVYRSKITKRSIIVILSKILKDNVVMQSVYFYYYLTIYTQNPLLYPLERL